MVFACSLKTKAMESGGYLASGAAIGFAAMASADSRKSFFNPRNIVSAVSIGGALVLVASTTGNPAYATAAFDGLALGLLVGFVANSN